jgi:hypothetical protein
MSALPADEAMERRLQEVDFAKSSLELSRSGQRRQCHRSPCTGERPGKALRATPWLQAKLTRLRELAERDPEMMSKEARFSSRKMSKRLVANCEVAFSVDETNMEMPAFLRKKSDRKFNLPRSLNVSVILQACNVIPSGRRISALL